MFVSMLFEMRCMDNDGGSVCVGILVDVLLCYKLSLCAGSMITHWLSISNDVAQQLVEGYCILYISRVRIRYT